jgi:hypothetical protein
MQNYNFASRFNYVEAFHGSLPQVTHSGIEATTSDRRQLDNRVTNNRNSTGNVTSRFYIGFTSSDQQKYRRKTSQSAGCLGQVQSSNTVRDVVHFY